MIDLGTLPPDYETICAQLERPSINWHRLCGIVAVGVCGIGVVWAGIIMLSIGQHNLGIGAMAFGVVAFVGAAQVRT